MSARARSKEEEGRDPILVVGLGLFGSATAKALRDAGADFIAVSEVAEKVEHYSDQFERVIFMDPSDRDALKQIGADQIRKAVVTLSKVELSIMTVLALHELGVEQIWARAATREHGEILSRIGAHKVIYSEASTGRRVAHAISGYMTDYFEFEDGFAIARTVVPRSIVGRPLSASNIRQRKEVTVVGIKRAGQAFIYAEPETVPELGDELIVSGKTSAVDKFCRLS